MAIEIICQGCSKKLRVPDEHAGKQARCPECGAIMAIPASALPTRAATGPFLGSPQTAPPDKWYLQTEDGHSYGPVPRAELDRWVADGRVTARSMLRREDEVNGTLATQLYPQLASSTAATSGQFSQAGANPFADRPVAPVSPVNPYAAPTSYGGKYRQAHRGPLILTFGILSFFCCFFFGIAAWAMGADDLKKMRIGLMDPSGEGLTRAGLILGIVSCVLNGLVILLQVVGAIVGGLR